MHTPFLQTGVAFWFALDAAVDWVLSANFLASADSSLVIVVGFMVESPFITWGFRFMLKY